MPEVLSLVLRKSYVQHDIARQESLLREHRLTTKGFDYQRVVPNWLQLTAVS